MASEAYFKTTFLTRIEENWKDIMTKPRVQSLWLGVKDADDAALKAVLERVVKEIKFPGIDQIINQVTIENQPYARRKIIQLQNKVACDHCSGGIRQAAGKAWRCTCELGNFYKNLAPYNGEVSKQEIKIIGDEQITETNNYIFRKKIGSKNLRDHSFTIKW